MDRYGEMIPRDPSLQAALVPRYQLSYVFVSKEEVLYLRNVVWKRVCEKQMVQSGMSNGDNAAKKVWKSEEDMLYQDTEDVYFKQKTAELMCAIHANMECFLTG